MNELMPNWVKPFLDHYALHGLKATAAKAVGVSTTQVDKLAQDCIEFEDSLREVAEQVADKIEAEVYRRAVTGIPKGIYYQGELMAEEVQYSDSLLQTLIKAKRRREFGDKTELTGPGGSQLQIFIRSFDDPNAPTPSPQESLPVIDAEFTTLSIETDDHELV